jgi:aryl-alcohol dehydrogenase-like predicted oxidoreductase
LISNPIQLLKILSLNLNHIKMLEAMGLKIVVWSPLDWHHLATKYEDLLGGSEVISGAHTDRHTHRETDRHTGDLISLL